jgi:hypothetical protein
MMVRSAGELVGTKPLFLLPHAPGSSLLYDALIRETAPAFAIDFPTASPIRFQAIHRVLKPGPTPRKR